MITHFNMMSLNYSPIMTAFYAAIFPFINFDIFNVAGKLDEFYEWLFPDLDDEKNYGEEAVNLGYESLWISTNMGSQTILIFWTAISFAFFFLITKVTPSRSRVNRYASSKHRGLKWAGITDMINDIYLNMSFAVIMNSTALSVANFSMTFQSVFTIIMDIMLPSWPIFVTA